MTVTTSYSATVSKSALSAVRAEPTVVDRVEARLIELGGEVRQRGDAGPDFAHVDHTFTPGLYTRTIRMAAGAIITSEVHRTEHPFVVHQGRCYVFNESSGEWTLLQAPYMGITRPGTRRLLLIVQETVWSTFHATDKTDVTEIENEILEPRSNPLIPSAERKQELEAGE